jgi:hypothetical protein
MVFKKVTSTEGNNYQKNWFVITQFRKFMTRKQILDGCKKYHITEVIYDFDLRADRISETQNLV